MNHDISEVTYDENGLPNIAWPCPSCRSYSVVLDSPITRLPEPIEVDRHKYYKFDVNCEECGHRYSIVHPIEHGEGLRVFLGLDITASILH